MKIGEKLKEIEAKAERMFDQGEHDYDYGEDVGKKVLYALVVFLSIALEPGWVIAYCIMGKLFVITPIQMLLKNKTSEKRLFNMSERTWKRIVFITLLIINIYVMIDNMDDFFVNLVAVPITFFICFFILAGVTQLKYSPGDPNKKGSPEWREKMGIEQVDFDPIKPVYRDKNGNYYEGTGWVPVPPPVNVINKDK